MEQWQIDATVAQERAQLDAMGQSAAAAPLARWNRANLTPVVMLTRATWARIVGHLENAGADDLVLEIEKQCGLHR